MPPIRWLAPFAHDVCQVGYPPSVTGRGSEQSTWRRVLADRAAEGNAAGLLYGALVSAAVIAVASGHAPTYGRVVLAVAVTLVVYWLAHVYTRVLAERLATPAAPLRDRARAAARHEAAILRGGLPSLLALVVTRLCGADVSTSAEVALWLTVGLLAATGYLAGYAAGSVGWRLAAESGGAALLGVIAVLLNILLH